jgi:4-amino-4-deoxy-L-arabinose transferase-like glycosyltransferase
VVLSVLRHGLAIAPVLAICFCLLRCRVGLGRVAGLTLLIWAALALAVSETASAFGALNAITLAVSWLAIAALFVLAGLRRGQPGWFPLRWASLSRVDRVVAVYLVLLAAVALIYPPNNYDSLTYHLARVEHWIQDASLVPYPTAIERQISSAPLAEILVLQFRLLSGDDLFSNLVQWLALLGAVSAAPDIARLLGAPRSGQSLAALFIVTTPMALLQATSTQTDAVAGCFAVLFVGYALSYLETGKRHELAIALLAVSLGFLVKVTALLAALGFGAWLLCGIARRTPRRLPAVLLSGAAVFLLVNALFLWRNLHSFGVPSPDAKLVGSSSFGPVQTLATAAMDIGMNAATGLPKIDAVTTRWLQAFCDLIGAAAYRGDLQLNGAPFALESGRHVFHEDYASNPLQLIQLALAALGALAYGRQRPRPALYLACLGAGCLAFATILRWQPFVTRLELPFFFLAGPLVGAVFGATPEHPRRAGIAAWILAIGALPCLLFNPIRPVFPPARIFESRVHNTFANNRRWEASYAALADRIRADGIHDLGLLFEFDDWEFPVWLLLRDETAAGALRIEHLVHGAMAVTAYPLGAFTPDAVLTKGKDLPDRLELPNGIWQKVLDQPPLALYEPAP